MNILIVGPHGQLGHAILPLARSRGHSVTPVGRDRLDLARPEEISAVVEPLQFDLLINCAGYHGTDRIETEPGAAFDVNGRAPGGLAAVCRERGARLVHVSSDYVFDGEADRPYTETDRPAPINVYGASKLLGESLARREHPEGALVVRTASVFGRAAEGHGSGNFVETVLRVVGSGGSMKVVDDVVMPPTYADDLAEWILDLVDGDAPAGIYHAVNAGEASWYEFAAAVAAVAGLDGEVEAVPSSQYPTAAQRPRYSVLDAGRAAGYTRFRPWREALEEYLGYVV